MAKEQQRKIYKGEKNDKERTKGKLIAAVGKVLEEKGYTGLTSANISKLAGVDRKLIAVYFGTIDNLVETYIKGKDYWVASTMGAVEYFGQTKSGGSRQFLEALLLKQMEEFSKNVEMQKAVVWQISERSSIMAEVAKEREKLSAIFFAFADREIEGKNIDLRAVSSVLVAGIYHLILFSKNTDSPFCEIDLSTKEGMDRIQVAVKKILEWAYTSPEI